MKHLLNSFLFTLIIWNNLSGQVPKVQKVGNEEIVFLLNNLKKLTNYENSTRDLFIKVYSVYDLGSTVGSETHEVNHTIYIAVSEDGEAGEQSLFKLGSLYNPKVVKWFEDKEGPKLVLSYGPVNKKIILTIRIGIKDLKITS